MICPHCHRFSIPQEKKCPVCGDIFKTLSRKTKLCGKPSCILENRKRLIKRWLSARPNYRREYLKKYSAIKKKLKENTFLRLKGEITQ